MAPVLGIDLGTTNSVVAIADGEHVRVLADEEGQRLIPSVVSFHPHGDVLVGYPARDRRLIDAKNTIYSVKRLLGRAWGSSEVERARQRFGFELREGPNKGVLAVARNETFTLPEISAFVLREVRRVAEHALGEEVSEAVVTCPANFNELQRSATKAAGKVAGLEVLRILNEPTAAALAYGYGGVGQGGGRRERIAIYDLGGGTFDITLLELAGDVFEVLATAGDTFLGGDDVDLAIAEHMAQAFLRQHRFDPRTDPQAFERLRAAGEWAKCQLTNDIDVTLRVEELAYGPGGQALDLSFSLRRGELEAMSRPLVEKTLEVCDEALRVAKLHASQLDRVILVGGSTRMPLVRQRVGEHFGRPPMSTIDPDVVVAQGAALHGYALKHGGARPSSPPKAMFKVALRKGTMTGLADERRQQLAAEAAAERPGQPAFAPASRPMPPRRPVAPPPTGFGLFDEAADDAAIAHAPPEPRLPASRPLARSSSIPPERASAPPPLPTRSSAPPPLPTRSSAPPPLPAAVVVQRRAVAVGVAPPPPPPPPPPSPSAGWTASSLPAPPSAPPVPSPPRDVAPQVDAFPMPRGPAPLLLDVTPQTLGVETVSGYCEGVIPRNAAIPVEEARVFTTAADDQDTVLVRVVQGDAKRIEENQELGRIELSGLRRARRGAVKIEVRFVLSTDGTLGVHAVDLETGHAQATRIQLVGGMTDAQIGQMAARQAAMLGGARA